MSRVPYIVLRGLELEGRNSLDEGGWNLTVRRLEAGEGVPLPEDPASMIEVADHAPLPSAPKVPPSKRVRSFCYRRTRSSEECERYLRCVLPDVPVSLELFAGWSDPPGGGIPMPAEDEQPLETTHLVVLRDYSSERREFTFQNTWGDKWGIDGHGSIPYDYIDKYGFESWVAYFDEFVTLESSKTKLVDDRQERRWAIRDEWRRRIYGFEVRDERAEDRQAWTFVLERDGALEIEELYVRPEYREQGYARILCEKVKQLAQAKKQPLRLWVPFADCKHENPSNYPALIAITRLLGLQFQPCPEIWAAYFATNERPGEEFPVEPARIPARPKSTLEAVLAMDMMVADANPKTTNYKPPTAARTTKPTDDEDFPAVGSEEWGIMNRRRAELIRKKNRQGLTSEEETEYERLQRLSQAALEQAFPAPTELDEKLDRLEARLRRERKTRSE